MGIQFVDLTEDHLSLLPLTYTRPVSQIRVGIFTISEKWQKRLSVEKIGFVTSDYLSRKFSPLDSTAETFWLNGSLLPSPDLVDAIVGLKENESLYSAETFLASKGATLKTSKKIEFSKSISRISKPWDIFRKNGEEIRNDLQLLPKALFVPLDDPHTICYGEDIFIEKGAKIKSAVLNAENGPIYIGQNAQVQEGSLIRGPFALCEGAVVSMGAKMRGDITIGPYSKVGGEVSNSVFFAYSNKAHDGFLGNSVIGEWCNFGAGSTGSNLKNTYGEISLWDYASESAQKTGLQFCGLIMGDHSKSGINSMFNTGTSIGVSCNVFGAGFPPTMIPSFSWGGSEGLKTHRIKEAKETAVRVLERRNLPFGEIDEEIFESVFQQSSPFRTWDSK